MRTIRIGTKARAFKPDQISHQLLGILGYAPQGIASSISWCTSTIARAYAVGLPRNSNLSCRTGCPPQSGAALARHNDSEDESRHYTEALADMGAARYYVFCRPTRGHERFVLWLQDGVWIVNGARARLSGRAKRFQYVGSHATEKIEIVGVLAGRIVLCYCEVKAAEDQNRLRSWPAARPVSGFDEILASAVADTGDRREYVAAR